MSLEIGIILGDRYRIDDLLGEGGMGAVYRALDLRLNLTVAVKEHFEDPTGRLRSSTDPTARAQLEKARERFQNEAQVLARLRHPGLPVVHDHFVIPEQGQYLVMDLVEGQDMQSLADQAGSLREDSVIQIGIQVCEILEYLHSQDPPVIHRDIKPANLRVTTQGKIILVDFGICKEGTGQATKTAARAVSEGFSPPEMYHQRGKSDARSDIYSLGATLLALLTGEEIPSPTERVMGKSLPRILDRTGNRQSELMTALNKAMELKTEDRYPNTTEFSTELASISGHAKLRSVSSTSTVLVAGASTSQNNNVLAGRATRVVNKEESQFAVGSTPVSEAPDKASWTLVMEYMATVGIILLCLIVFVLWYIT